MGEPRFSATSRTPCAAPTMRFAPSMRSDIWRSSSTGSIGASTCPTSSPDWSTWRCEPRRCGTAAQVTLGLSGNQVLFCGIMAPVRNSQLAPLASSCPTKALASAYCSSMPIWYMIWLCLQSPVCLARDFDRIEIPNFTAGATHRSGRRGAHCDCGVATGLRRWGGSGIGASQPF